jgi:hypothetical protein
VYNYPVLFVDQIGKSAMPTLFSVMKSSTPAALKLNTFIACQIPSQPFWNNVWELTTKAKPFKKGSAYIWQIRMLRETTKEERDWASNVYKLAVANRNIASDIEESASDVV